MVEGARRSKGCSSGEERQREAEQAFAPQGHDAVDASTYGIAFDVLESLHEGCQVIGFDFSYLHVNEAVVRQGRQSREQLIGHAMTEHYPGIDRTPMFAALRACMSERVYSSMENEFRFPDGSTGWFELRFVPVPQGVCILSLDITARKRSEAELARTESQLRHAQKMDAVGRLAGGVAHDFNNLLSVILSYATLILADARQDDPLRNDVEEIRKAGLRATELTRQLLTFSRHQVLEPRLLDLGQLVGDMENMLRRLLGADVVLTRLPSPSLGKVRVDPSAVEQVLLNLVVNARDAMPTGGKLTIETTDIELDESYARTHLDVRPGPYVLLAVSDTGTGMDRETQARIFEPYFTTKERGKGTGLGLSTVYGIVKKNAGHIWVYSEPGAGASFKVYFPRDDAAVSVEPSSPPASEASGGNETILVVEDDEQVRAIACNILRRAGYRVLDAPNGGEALLICEQHPATIHLLVTDVVLPRMSGRQLAERLAGLRPEMSVLFMSGYTEEAVMQHGILESQVAYFQKPVTPESLTRKVRQVLDQRAAHGGKGLKRRARR